MTRDERAAHTSYVSPRRAWAAFLVALTWLAAAPIGAQVDLLSHTPEILVIDSVIEYAGPAGAGPFVAPAMAIVPKLKGFWSIPIDHAAEKGHAVAAAKLDGFG